MNYLSLAIALLAASSTAFCAETLSIDASHSAVVFSWNHRGYSHPLARFEKIDGKLLLDRADLTKSTVWITLPLAGLRTGDEHLDKRLKGAEFLDAAAYPTITFKSTQVEALDPDTLRIKGDLSVHGITRSVVLDTHVNKISADAGEDLTAGFDANAAIRRSDFGITRYVPMVTDQLAVHITVEAHRG